MTLLLSPSSHPMIGGVEPAMIKLAWMGGSEPRDLCCPLVLRSITALKHMSASGKVQLSGISSHSVHPRDYKPQHGTSLNKTLSYCNIHAQLTESHHHLDLDPDPDHHHRHHRHHRHQ